MFVPSGVMSVRDGRLYIEDCDAVGLANKYETPAFVISEKQLRDNARRIRTAFADLWPEGTVEIYPAFKAAPYIAVRKILSEEGLGCDTFGPSELEGAIRGGVDPAKISINGSIKSREVIAHGIEIGSRIVIDAPGEVQICREEAERLGNTARIMLRLKPDLTSLPIESDFAPMPVGDITQRVRYGMPDGEALDALRAVIESPNLDLIGFHCHIGRQSTDLTLWAGLVENMVDLMINLCGRAGLKNWRPDHLDFGGGFAPPKDFDTDGPRTGDAAPPIEAYAEVMLSALRKRLTHHGLTGDGLVVEVEPGRCLHSDTGVHLTTVRNIKRGDGNQPIVWAEMDTSEQFLGTYAMDPTSRIFNYLIANKADAPPEITCDLVGKSCGGEMILLDAEVPQLEDGDVVALMDTGAYIESLGCNFNAMPRPGTLLVRGARAEWIRRPETIEEVYARDTVPDFAE